LENDWDIAGIEELDGVGACHSSCEFILDWNIDSETLEEDDDGEDYDGSEEVGDVGELLSVEGFFEGSDFVVSGDKKVDESYESSFELRPACCCDRCWGERFPNNGFTDIGGNK